MKRYILFWVTVLLFSLSCTASLEEGIILSPRDGESVRGVVVIVVSPPSEMIVDRVEIQINGVTQKVIPAPGSYTYEWDTTPLSNGFYRITVDVYDIEGNKKSETIEVQVTN